MVSTKTPRNPPSRPTTRAGRKAAVGKRPPGQPSAIDRPLTTADGTVTTVGENIVRLIRDLGTYTERAAASSGIGKATLYGWLERAAKARSKIALALTSELTPHDYRCVEFADAVEVAEATWELASLAALDRIANGTVNLATTTERYGIVDGEATLLETTTKLTALAPNAHVIMWRLTRKFPERYQVRHDPGAAGSTGSTGGLGDVDLTPDKVAGMVADVEAFAREFTEG